MRYEIWWKNQYAHMRVCTHRWKWVARLEMWLHPNEPVYLRQVKR